MKSLKVVAVASSEQTRSALYAQLQGLDFLDFNGVYIELSDAARECQAVGPDVIIVDTTGRELDAGLFIQAIGMNPENPCVIYALHKEMDINVFREAIKQGAREFIQYPEDKQALETALRKHLALVSKMVTQNKPQPTAEEALAQQKQGRILAVFAAKGGAGSTTVAANLAYELRQKDQSVVLFDLDQVFCNSAITLNQKPSYSVGDLADTNADDVDNALIDKIIIKDESGMGVVVGSKSVLDDNAMIAPDLLERILDYLTAKYAYVIIDLPTHVLDPYHQYIVERADDMLLVSTPDIPSLYRTRQYLDLAEKYLDMKKIKMVLNRYNLKAAYRMSNQEVEQQFRYDIYSRLPNDWDLNVEANSLGTVLGKVNPKADLVKAIQTMAAQLIGDEALSATPAEPAVNGKGSGLLGKLFTSKSGQKAQTSKS